MTSERCPQCGSDDPGVHPVRLSVSDSLECPNSWHNIIGNTLRTVDRYADPAQFVAEPIDATTGPRVYLLSINPDPLGSIAAACKMYKGEVVRDLSEVTDAERLEYLGEMQKTKLQAPLEFVKFHFLLEGVTRSLTHQLVRQRTAVYAQESLRFAVKEDLPNSTGLPPSLTGTEGDPSKGLDGDWWDSASHADRMRAQWDAAIR